MVFSSIPVYLDPPNWHQQQQQNHHPHNLATTTADHHHHQLPPLPPPPPSQPPHAAGTVSSSGGSIRPGSMADRARLAKIPQPESALKCPRCESSNTKFCYFNNYSLTQPRHFCKTCRRYWTRGGALRTVPVGGGCRRNKKSSKSSGGRSNSKSPATTATTSTSEQNSNKRTANPSGIISPSLGATAGVGEMIGHFSQNPFMAASIQNLARFGGHGSLGLNFSEMGQVQAQNNEHGTLGFQVGPSGGSADETSEDHQWRLQQFSLFGGSNSFEPSSSTANLYPLFSQGSGMESQSNGMVGMMMSSSGGSRVSEMISSSASVKLEGRQGLNLSSPPSLAISESNTNNNNNNNNSFWAGNSSTSWTDLSGLNSSSTSHLL